MSGVLGGQPDWLQWGVGVVGGAGAAGAVQALTSTLRLGSSATTGGLGNWILATFENLFALIGSVLALVAPVLAALGLALAAWVVWRFCRRRNTPETT